jgi:hypothetical protein
VTSPTQRGEPNRLPSTAVFTGILISGAGSLWFSRLYYFNSSNVGWGDVSADRSQLLFRCATTVAVAVLFMLVTFAAMRFGWFRLALIVGAAVSGVALVFGGCGSHVGTGFLLLPGILTTAMSFGIHSDLCHWPGMLWIFELCTVFYATLTAGIIALLGGRKLEAKS